MILTILKWLAMTVAAIVLLLAAVYGGLRFHDGPLEIIRGGPFKTGESYQGPEPDWGFLKDRVTVEFQLLDPPTSRTVWLAVHDDKLYFLSGYMATGFGKIWKKWPHYVQKDNRAILRVDGKLYDRRLIRITSGPVLEAVTSEINRKYSAGLTPGAIINGEAWLYEVAPG